MRDVIVQLTETSQRELSLDFHSFIARDYWEGAVLRLEFADSTEASVARLVIATFPPLLTEMPKTPQGLGGKPVANRSWERDASREA